MQNPVLNLVLSIQTGLTAKCPVHVHLRSASRELNQVLAVTMVSDAGRMGCNAV
jgi:hypothetical protein